MNNNFFIMDDDGEIASKEWIKNNPEKVKKQQVEHKKLNDIYPLKQKDFFEILNKELDKKIVKEEETRKTILLIALGGKLVDNAEATSSNLMVNDDSGAGKDYCVRSVLKLLPKEDVIKQKRISEKVFTYWHNHKREPDWDWSGKVFYNEDITNTILNSDVFKVFSSNDRNDVAESTILINQSPFEIGTKGKPVMIITIALASPKIELLRRFPICNLDTTEDQTKLILKRKAQYHKDGLKPEYDKAIIRNLSKLKRVNVSVPFADKLTEILSTKNIIIRTHFDRFMDYIKFSCAIHQYQREKDEKGYYLAQKEDYDLGRLALIKTTSNVFSVPLTRNQQKILEIMRESDQELWYSVTELEPKVTFCSDRTLRTELDKLTNFGFLEKDKQERADSKKDVMVYRYLGLYKIDIPKWEKIQNISSVSSLSFNSNVSNVSNDKNINQTFISNETNETNEANPRPSEMIEIEDLSNLE